MADRLTASQILELSDRNIRNRITRAATLTNDSGGWVITPLVKEWGSSKFEIYNKHPDDRGRLRFPTFSLLADNSEGDFDIGGTYFPNGRPDLFSTTIRFQSFIYFADGTTYSALDFYGQLKEPEIDNSGTVTLLCEHPLTVLTGRKWVRDDRIGGDTGIDEYFNS